MQAPASLLDLGVAVLHSKEPDLKVRAANNAVTALEHPFELHTELKTPLPLRPARPERPPSAHPSDVPKRRLGSEAGRATLLHAIAHIEFNAIDLAFDMAARFAQDIEGLGLNHLQFTKDWFSIGGDEAYHFTLINRRLSELGAGYGDFPAHHGLWDAAEKTAGDLLGRLVAAPLILEARGLDVTPGMISRLQAVGDNESADILKIIYSDEIGHVACGKRWFHAVCKARSLDPVETFHKLREQYLPTALKPPFNAKARQAAGLSEEYYAP